jgi:hypothetical protein
MKDKNKLHTFLQKRALCFDNNYFAFSPLNSEIATITAARVMLHLILGYDNHINVHHITA